MKGVFKDTMNLIKQTGPFCLVASAAMILDTTVEQLHREIGTDGTEIWWPNHMRGIHIQEIQDCCLRRNKCLYPIEMNPLLAPNEFADPKACLNPIYVTERLRLSVLDRRAILITDNHAVAWNGKEVYDPKGFVKSFNDYPYIFKEAWILGVI